jgi:hypothetical protein
VRNWRVTWATTRRVGSATRRPDSPTLCVTLLGFEAGERQPCGTPALTAAVGSLTVGACVSPHLRWTAAQSMSDQMDDAPRGTLMARSRARLWNGGILG